MGNMACGPDRINPLDEEIIGTLFKRGRWGEKGRAFADYPRLHCWLKHHCRSGQALSQTFENRSIENIKHTTWSFSFHSVRIAWAYPPRWAIYLGPLYRVDSYAIRLIYFMYSLGKDAEKRSKTACKRHVAWPRGFSTSSILFVETVGVHARIIANAAGCVHGRRDFLWLSGHIVNIKFSNSHTTILFLGLETWARSRAWACMSHVVCVQNP